MGSRRIAGFRLSARPAEAAGRPARTDRCDRRQHAEHRPQPGLRRPLRRAGRRPLSPRDGRADWRARYSVISEQIRQTKATIREARAKGYTNNVSGLQSDLAYERKQANKLMLELAEAKEFKNAQLAERQQAAA